MNNMRTNLDVKFTQSKNILEGLYDEIADEWLDYTDDRWLFTRTYDEVIALYDDLIKMKECSNTMYHIIIDAILEKRKLLDKIYNKFNKVESV